MRRWTLLSCAVAISLAVTGAAQATPAKKPAPVVAPRPTQTPEASPASASLGDASRPPILFGPAPARLWIAFQTAVTLCQNRVQRVTVTSLGDVKRLTARDSSQNSYVVYEEGGKRGSAIQLTQADDQYRKTPDGNAVLMHKGMGSNASWIGLDSSDRVYYMLRNGTQVVRIGVWENQYRQTPPGDAVRMSKGLGTTNRFAGDAGGRLYQLSRQGAVTAVGELGWFWVTDGRGERLQHPVLMSKGIGPGHKWAGEHDGVVYVEK
jgi:hypothetical protein